MFFLLHAANAQINISFNVTQPTCFGLPTGSVTAVASGGTGSYTYLWSTGQMGATLSGIPAGNYSVTVTDSGGSSGSNSVTVNQPSLVVVNLTANVCQTPFVITANGSGGVPGYTYSWSTGQTGSSITVAASGTYCVTMTDQNLCGAVDCIDVSYNPLNVTVTTNGLTCPGSNDGQVTAVATGGTPPYSYLWSNGATTASQGNLPPGTYTVTVTDAGGCTDSASGTVLSPPPLIVDATGTGPNCPGGNNGSASASANGGTPPYTYLWNTGAMTASITNLSAGSYSVTVTDANGCTGMDVVTLNPLSNLMASANATPESCPDTNDGSATATPSGGVPPYTYIWSNGGNTATINGLAPGLYTVTITDGAGCTASASATVAEAPAFNISVTSTDVTTCGAADGSATANILQGEAPFTYQWSNGAATQTISGLAGGTYSVTVTDANGCTETGSALINEPPDVSVLVIATDVVCPGASDGEAAAIVSGGTPPFSYLWNTGATTPSISNLPAGAYSVTVTDAFGCQDSGSATIIESPGVSVTITGTESVCSPETSGQATAMPSGGTPPYSYLWSTGATTQTIISLPEGTFSVTVTDASGCTATAEFDVDIIDDLVISGTSSPVLCFGEATGAINTTVSGGTPPYTYLWSNGAATAGISNLPAGIYSLTVTEANGCQATRVFPISQPAELVATATGVNSDCSGMPMGSASVSVAGGTPPYTYLWSNGATTQSISNLMAGAYSVTVTDANLCTDTASVTLTSPQDIVVNLTAQNVLCFGGATGSVSASVSGGTPPYTYNWSNGGAGASIGNLPAGNYSLTVTDANGCQQTASAMVTQPPSIAVTVTSTNGTCSNASTGSASVSASGGTPPYSYLWSNGATGTGISNVAGGNYTVTVTDANGCTNTGSVSIQSFPAPSCMIIVTNQVSPAGNDGAAECIVSSGTPPFTINWSNGQTGPTATNLAPGTYSATVTDANGCQTTCSVTLAPPARLGDYVWLDIDRDGIQDPSEDGIPGVMVILQIPSDNDPTNIDTTFTNGNGYYYFDVIPGDYKVLFIKPGGLTFTNPNQGANDAADSDVDTIMGMTGVYTIGPGETNLTIDAGLYPKCDNITDPGLIGPNQFLCGPGNDPDPILNLETPSGGSGNIEYLWMVSTQPGPFNVQTWVAIPGANGPSYDPPVVYETTYFARCARRECCTAYLETNIVTIEVGSVAVADIQGPAYICVGETETFHAAQAGAGAVINWTFSGPVTPNSASGTPVQITATNFGIITMTLTVTENGCTSTDIKSLTATNSPIYCAQLLPIDVDVIDQEAGEVMISWMVEESLEGLMFKVEHSKDGNEFRPLGQTNTPRAYLGSMSYYEFGHYEARPGRNYYRLRVEAPNGEVFYSEVGEAIIYTDSKVAMLYPNPTSHVATLEIFETFETEVQAEVLNAQGARMWAQTLPADVKRIELDLSEYPAGAYFLRLRYGRAGEKVLKMLKH